MSRRGWWEMERITGARDELRHAFEVDGEGVILLTPSGVLWTNQTGGIACPVVEGVFVRLSSLPNPRGPASAGGLAENVVLGHFEAREADEMDAFFARHDLPFRVDRAMLDQSEEAWVYVRTLAASDQYRGVLIAGQMGVYVHKKIVYVYGGGRVQ